MRKSSQPIACDLHDYLEIACLYGYDLEVLLSDGTTIAARAVTTKTVDGQEYLVTRSETGELDLLMTEIVSVTALTRNAVFSKIEFS